MSMAMSQADSAINFGDTDRSTGGSIWMWIGIAVVAIVALVLLTGRRS